MTSSGIDRDYLRLAGDWLPHAIADDTDYAEAVDVAFRISEQVEQGRTLSAGEQMYLDAVLELLEAYDRRRGSFPEADSLPLPERLRALMEVRGMNQSQLAEAAGLSRGNISDVLAGRRELSKAAAKRLAGHFRLEVGHLL